MKPQSPRGTFTLRRRDLLLGTLALAGGCTSPTIRSQSPDVEEFVENESRVHLVGDLAGPWGLNYIKLEGVALITGLAGTGSDPAPSPQRDVLIHEMQTHDVESPNQVLASPSTSLVLVQGFMPPGIQKGETFDVEVRIPSRSETTSLRDGWLLQTRLRELAVLDNQIHSGEVAALAQGSLLVDALVKGEEDPTALTRARILGGGVSRKSRTLGLVLRNGQQSVLTSSLIGTAVNRRFHTFDRGLKTGVCKPLRDDFLELLLHPRYKNNLMRYVRVVSSIPIRESASDRNNRLRLLGHQLLEPTTSATAALRLEALGTDAIEALNQGLESNLLEVRFYAAEALAYLDQPQAANPLGDIARAEPAFRWHALTALSAMDDVAAYDELIKLLEQPSAETRYGALRALQARNPHDPLVSGQDQAGRFRLVVLDSSSEPMVHLTRTRAAEVSLFGRDQALQSPLLIFAGKEIMLKSTDDGRIKVSRFTPGKEQRHADATAQLADVIRAVVAVDGSYADVVTVIKQAKAGGYLRSRVEVDAMPQTGRTYHRPGREGEETGEPLASPTAGPLPTLFAALPGWTEPETPRYSDEDLPPSESPRKQQPWWNLFGRMRGR